MPLCGYLAGSVQAVNTTVYQHEGRECEPSQRRSSSSIEIPLLVATSFVKMLFIAVSLTRAAKWTKGRNMSRSAFRCSGGGECENNNGLTVARGAMLKSTFLNLREEALNSNVM